MIFCEDLGGILFFQKFTLFLTVETMADTIEFIELHTSDFDSSSEDEGGEGEVPRGWTEDQFARLRELYQTNPRTSWFTISEKVNKSVSSCRSVVRNYIDQPSSPSDKWSEEEDTKLKTLAGDVKNIGWEKVAEEFPTRTVDGCKMRFWKLNRTKHSRRRQLTERVRNEKKKKPLITCEELIEKIGCGMTIAQCKRILRRMQISDPDTYTYWTKLEYEQLISMVKAGVSWFEIAVFLQKTERACQAAHERACEWMRKEGCDESRLDYDALCVKIRKWTHDEIRELKKTVELFKSQGRKPETELNYWENISLRIKARTSESCKKQWESLQAELKKRPEKRVRGCRTEWGEEEDAKLLQLYKEYGNHWKQYDFPGRSPDSVRKRYKVLSTVEEVEE